MTRKGYKWLVIVSIAAVSIILLLSLCHLTQYVQAILLLSDIAAREKGSPLKKITPTPTRTLITYRIDGRKYAGDLYRPGNRTKAGILLIPGAAEEGKDDPRLVAFATTLARGHFTVLVPDLVGMRKLQVGSYNIREVIDSFIELDSLPGAAPKGRGGICAFSYAVGPAILASLSREIRDRVCFIMGIGGYHDLTRVLTFFTTGYFQAGERWQHGNPNEYGKWIFVLSNVGSLSDPKDRLLFTLMAKRMTGEPKQGIEDLAIKLGPEGRRFYDFIVNRDPSRVPLLISRLPIDIRHEIASLTLTDKDLSALKAKLILVHGLDDDIIPYTESEALARSVPRGRADLYLAKGLFHVDVKPGFRDSWQLWRAVADLLETRDRETCN